jgi:hypothetical protein
LVLLAVMMCDNIANTSTNKASLETLGAHFGNLTPAHLTFDVGWVFYDSRSLLM